MAAAGRRPGRGGLPQPLASRRKVDGWREVFYNEKDSQCSGQEYGVHPQPQLSQGPISREPEGER